MRLARQCVVSVDAARHLFSHTGLRQLACLQPGQSSPADAKGSSRSHEAEDRFGGLTIASFSTRAFPVSVHILSIAVISVGVWRSLSNPDLWFCCLLGHREICWYVSCWILPNDTSCHLCGKHFISETSTCALLLVIFLIKPVRCPSVCLQVRPMWCQYFQNLKALRTLGWSWWNLAGIFYGSRDKLLVFQSLHFNVKLICALLQILNSLYRILVFELVNELSVQQPLAYGMLYLRRRVAASSPERPGPHRQHRRPIG